MTSQELVEILNGSCEEWAKHQGIGPGTFATLGKMGRMGDSGPFVPVDSEGKIVSFIRFNPDAVGGDEDQVSYTLFEVGVDKGWLAEHPEGWDRGGYCAFVWAGEAVAFFHSGEWQVG